MPGIKFGVEPNMREVPPGETATIKLANWSKWEIKETDYGMKYCIPVTLLSHPSYDSIPKEGLKSTWTSKSKAAENLLVALNSGIKELTKAFEEEKWELIRSPEGVYFLQQL